MCSSPTNMSIMSGSTPAARYCAWSNWRCLVDAGSMLSMRRLTAAVACRFAGHRTRTQAVGSDARRPQDVM
jgi:hypothetical protein